MEMTPAAGPSIVSQLEKALQDFIKLGAEC